MATKKATRSQNPAQNSLEISGILLREHHVMMDKEFAPLPFLIQKENPLIQYMHGVVAIQGLEGETEKKTKEVYYLFKQKFGVRLALPIKANKSKKEPRSEKVLFELEAVYDVIYKLKEGQAVLTQEKLAPFAQTNAPFHVWPFWREHVASTMQKMGLQPIAVPLYFMSPGA